jgi:hypothetical protein
MLEAASVYLSAKYHAETGPLGWNSDFFANPLNWLFTAALFSVGFFWQFRRGRPK